MMDQMKAQGYNTIRLPYCNQLFDAGSTPNGIDFTKNPVLQGLTGIQIMDIFRRLSRRGITIIMITHELSIAQCADKIYHILDGRLHVNGIPNAPAKEESYEEA
jgi:aryl carrier-like protein